MSTIGGVSSSGNAWATPSAQRSQHQAKMFAKVDTDGSGSVDQSELSAMLSEISQKTGTSLGDSKQLFTKMDTNGDGSLSSDELGQGMKDFLPPPTTMDFAQSHAQDGQPARSSGAGGTSGTQSTSSSSSSTTYDPLDVNQDGTVSSMERLAGMLKELAQGANSSDSSGSSGSSSNSEVAKLAQKLYEQISASLQQSGNSTTSTLSATA